VAKKSGMTRLLSTKERVVLTLTANGINDTEISEILNLQQGNIRQFRFKALRKLREQ
jgi:DNA-binding NarL/FixJ family response regulator